MSDDDLKQFAQHVEQASNALPQLIKKRDQLQADLTQLNQKIHALTNYISAFMPPGSKPLMIPMGGRGSVYMQIAPGGSSMVHAPQVNAPAQPPPAAVPVVAARAATPPSEITVTSVSEAVTTPTGRAPKGQVYEHVEGLLISGGKYTLRQIRDELLRRVHHEYGISSIHRAVTRGVQEKRYKVNNEFQYFKA